MSIQQFIPEVWSARLLESLNRAHVLSGLVNRDYEGDIAGFGDKVKITSIGSVTIRDYDPNTDMDEPEELSASQQMLEITQQKYFNFQVDDVDKAQARSSVMDSAMARSGYGLADVTDRWLAGVLESGADPANRIGSDAAPSAVTAQNAYDYLVKLKTILDKRDVPTIGRWAVVPPEFHGLLLTDERFVRTGGALAESILQNGRVGWAAGFEIYMSNNLPHNLGIYKVLAGHSAAATYAEQILQTEAYRLEKRFADGVKGLHVYGAKVLMPQQLAVLTCAFDSGILEDLDITSTASDSEGNTILTVSPALPAGYTASYQLGDVMPAYDAAADGFTALPDDGEIEADDGETVVVCYTDASGKVKAAGKTVVKTNA